jgi:hypothetical protein
MALSVDCVQYTEKDKVKFILAIVANAIVSKLYFGEFDFFVLPE